MKDNGDEGKPEWGDVEPVLVGKLTTESDVLVESGDFPGSQAKTSTIPVGSLVLIGGYTRVSVAEQLGIKEAPAVVKVCSWQDAVRLAWQQNSRHGTPRTEKDLRFVLDCIHADPKYRKLSDRQIASFVGCSRATVNRYRDLFEKKNPAPDAELAVEGAPSPKIYRDAWGQEIPPMLVDSFRSVEAAKGKADRLRKIALEFVTLKYGGENSQKIKEPGMKLIDVKDVAADLYSVADMVEAALPFIVCPDCEGEGEHEDGDSTTCCETCKGEGYLLRAGADNLPPEYERQARKGRAA